MVIGSTLAQQSLGSIVIGYILMCIVIGIFSAGKIKNLRQFALGYKNISTSMLVATIYATHLGAGATLGLIEQINNIGIVAALIGLLSAARWHFSKIIFCNKVARFKDCLGQADIMKTLFGPFAFFVCNITNVICSIGFVAIQIMMLGFVIQYFFGVSTETGIMFGAFAVTAYSASGGIKAVILTDLMQALLFAIVLVGIFIVSVYKLEAQPDFWQSIPASKMWITPYDWRSTLMVIGMIVYALVPCGDAPTLQRVLISGSDQQLHKTFAYTAVIDFIVLCIIAGVAVLMLPSTGEGTLTRVEIFEMVKSNMSPIFVTAVVVGIMAVTMSTADSWLNSGAVVITNYLVFKRSNITDIWQVRIARLSTIILGAAAAYSALLGGSVLTLLLITESLFIPVILMPMALGFLEYKFSESDYKRSVVTSIITVLISAHLEGEFGFISLLLGVISSIASLTWSKKWSFFKSDGGPIIQLPWHTLGNSARS